MKHIIKLTEEQIRETIDNTFNYLNGGDTPNYCGQTEISATGKLDQDKFGKPTTTDKISRSLSPQTYNRYGLGTQMYRRFQNTYEDSSANIDDDNGVDDFYKNDELDTLGNGVDNDNLTKIPQGVDYKLNALLGEIHSGNLSPKQQAIVLNKIIEDFNVEKMPMSWRKALYLKIKQ